MPGYQLVSTSGEVELLQQVRERGVCCEDPVRTLIVVAFHAALGCCTSRKLTTEAARCRRWCPQAQVPKLLEGTLIAISSRQTTALLAPGKLLA